MSPTSFSVAAKFGRVVSIVTRVFPALADATATFAFNLLSESVTCCRLSVFVPRINNCAVSVGAIPRFVSVCSLPSRRLTTADTPSPRFFLERRARRNPDFNALRCTRESMLAGDGSNDSPAATTASLR